MTIRLWPAVCVRLCSRRRPDAEIAVAHDFDSMVAALDASPDTDLVLLDLTMPGVRGFSGLRFLRWERQSTPVIVVSGNEDRAVIRHCIEFGTAGFIPKTNSLDTMRGAIAQVLDGGRRTPPDFDPSSAPNGESSAMARRLASLTPQEIRVLMMLSQGLLTSRLPMSSASPKRPSKRMCPRSSRSSTSRAEHRPSFWRRRSSPPRNCSSRPEARRDDIGGAPIDVAIMISGPVRRFGLTPFR
jgi:DNA-binding NarL/FixJ family response regulator